ncbi:MAG: TadE/TadG family type IV pilus assembly protein, partial [Chloroflexota bacterium]
MQKLKDQKTGQALVEFSLILVVLLMIIFVIIEGGRLFQSWVTVQNAAREGARYAITGQYDPSCLLDVPACPDPRVQSIKDVSTTASTGLSIDPTAGFDDPRYHEVEVFGINEYDAWQEDYAGNAGKTVLVRVIYRMPIITPLLRPIAESVPVVGQVTLNNENFVQVNNSKADNTPPDLPPPPTPGPPVADLQIEKSATPQVVLINEPINYLLRITNHGPKGANGIVVEDTLPAGVTFVSASPTGNCTHASGVVTCNPPDLPRGAVFDINIQVSAPSSPPPSPGEITNEATVTGAAIDDDPSNNSDSVNTLVVLDHTVADLELVSKDDLPDPVVVNQQLTYSIVVRNNGVNDATAVTVVDTLPTGLTYISSSLPGCIYNSGPRTVICAMGDLAVGETTSVDIQTAAPSSTGLIVNTATVSANEADPNMSNNSLTESTTISPEWTDLFVTKTDSPDPAPVGQNLQYFIQVGNNGPSNATNVTITDNLPGSVTFVSATPTQGTCSSSGNTVVCNLGSIQATNLANVNILVRPNNTGTISNRVTVSGDQSDPNNV